MVNLHAVFLFTIFLEKVTNRIQQYKHKEDPEMLLEYSLALSLSQSQPVLADVERAEG